MTAAEAAGELEQQQHVRRACYFELAAGTAEALSPDIGAACGAAGDAWVPGTATGEVCMAVAVTGACGAEGAVTGGWKPNCWAAERVSGRT